MDQERLEAAENEDDIFSGIETFAAFCANEIHSRTMIETPVIRAAQDELRAARIPVKTMLQAAKSPEHAIIILQSKRSTSVCPTAMQLTDGRCVHRKSEVKPESLK